MKKFNKSKLMKASLTPREWYNVKDGEEEAEVYIYDQIGQDWWDDGINPKSFMEEIKAIKAEKINIHVNSPGGYVYEGFAIYNFLNRLDKEIIMWVDGIAASIASVIVMAGDSVIMPANAELMIHDPWGLMIGTADDFRKEADQLDSVKESILGIYESRTGLSRERLFQMMKDETYIKGEEAQELGFADILEEPKKLAASMFDEYFNDGKIVAKSRRELEASLREAGYSKSEAVAIANRSESVKIGSEEVRNKPEKKNKTIIVMR